MFGQTKAGASTPALNQKVISAGGKSKRFDVSDYAEKQAETQAICPLCNPQIGNGQKSTANICESCTANQQRLEAELLAHLSKPRKVIRLHRCAACQNTVSPAKFSRDWAICKSCVSDVMSKSKLARSGFVERAVNNFRKMLKGVAAL